MTEQQTTDIPMLRLPRSAHPVPTTPRLRSALVPVWAYALVIVAVFAGSILVGRDLGWFATTGRGTTSLGAAETEAALLRAALDAETARWEEALRLTWQMVDPLKPAGEPGSYWRGQDAGIVAALTTLRANLKTPNAKLTFELNRRRRRSVRARG